ncbi:hypothetical protein TorRG33x02_054770 [Trema orientale]|uniref:Uncharacterized protein n=1 Tax=Trema orientale TaxID=63057 RepID=A0A2P5FM36_TREOI|nr:hypothetical protein TorRG33x02_054770 [Trema orientale]
MLKVWNLQTQHCWKLLLCWRRFRCLLIKDYQYIILKGDCFATHNGKLGDKEELNWDGKRLLKNCQSLLQQVQMWELPLVPREANSAAHKLPH